MYADEPGPGYNIDLTDFSIPGFKEAGLDKKFADIYAVSTGAMTGGFIGTKKVLSDDQIQKAQVSLSDNVQYLLQPSIMDTNAVTPSVRATGRWSNFSISGKVMSI